MAAASLRAGLVVALALALSTLGSGTAKARDLAPMADADLASAGTLASDSDSAIDGGASQVLQLAVVVNDRPTGQVAEFIVRGGSIYTRYQELLSLGLHDPRSTNGASGLVALASLPHFKATLEPSTQTLYVDAGNEWLVPEIIGADTPADSYRVDSGTGLTLNYDMVGTSAGGKQFGSGTAEVRAFSRFGVASIDAIFHAGRNVGQPQKGGFRAIRLDSTFVYSDPSSMRRYRFGDYISGSLPWTRPVRMGGAQISSDFSMRPDLITFPVPAVKGSASVPSTVDVLVNGNPVVSGAVDAGPFQVPQVPVISGAGTVTTTVTDALGRQVVTELPFYTSPTLLAPRLQVYSAEVGFVRRNWGLSSNDYNSLALSVSYRRGLTNYLTLEGHVEGSRGLAMTGVGAALNLANMAIAHAAVAVSRRSGRTGTQVAAAVERITHRYSFGVSAILASPDYRDIAAINGDPVTRFQLNANASLLLSRVGSIGIAYTEVKRSNHGSESETLPHPLMPSAFDLAALHRSVRSRLLTATYSRQLGSVGLYATAIRDFARQRSSSFFVGITIPLGHRTSASVTGQAARDVQSAQVEVNRSAIDPGQWGYRLFASAQRRDGSHGSQPTTLDHEFGEVTYRSASGQLFAGIDRVGGRTTVQGEISGAVSLLDGALFASNRIDDSFAVVHTGAAGIRVRHENRDVGRTDSRGRLLVSRLRSYDVNHLSIEPLDAPVDAEVPVVRRTVRPQDRSGVVVSLPVTVRHAALVRMVNPAGEPVPVGSVAKLRSTGVEVPVGYGGEAYFVDVESRNDVVVERGDGRHCSASFDYHVRIGDIPTIGPVVCREARQ